jgi:hypothetical protein
MPSEPPSHDEVDAVRAHHEEADDERGQARAGGGQGQRPPQRDRRVGRREEGQGITRDAEEGGVAERDQAGHALQQVQAHREDGQDHHLREHAEVEVAAVHGQQREHRQRDGAQREHELDAARQFFELGLG